MIFKANSTKALAENIRVLAKPTLGGFGGFFYGNNLHLCVAVCDLVIFFSMANLIYAIGKHRVPFGGGFAFDTIKGLLVYFDHFDIHDVSVEIVCEIAVWYLCICHSVSLFACICPVKGFGLVAKGKSPVCTSKPRIG